MQSPLHDKKSVKRDQISIFTKIPSHTSTYSLCSITNVSEHILFLLRWRTKEKEGCVPWNAEGVVCNMYLQHLHCAILHFAFLQLCMSQFCIFRGGLGLWLMCLACIHSAAEDWASWSAKTKSQRSFECPSYILQYPISMYYESVFSSTCTSLRVGVGSGWALGRVSVLKTSFSTPEFAAPCRRVQCWERLLRLCSHQCVEIWQNMTQMTKYKKGVLYEQYVSKSYQSSTPIWSEVCDKRKQVALFPSFIAKRQPGQK